MSPIIQSRRPLILGVVILLACALGFGIARWTTPTSAPTPPAASAETAARTALDVDPANLKTMGIETQVLRPGSLTAEIRAAASVVAAPNAQAAVTAHTAGTLVRLNKRLGDTVKSGEILASVESREGAAIAAAREVAESKAALARSVLEREKSLYEQHVTPRQDFEAAQAQMVAADAEARSARIAAETAHVSPDGRLVQVTSPLGGRIASVTATVGAFVQADTELFRVADPGHIQIEAAVSAADAIRVSPGDPATITTRSGSSIEATAVSVTPTVNEQSHSTTVVLTLRNAGGEHPSPGEFVQALITPRAAPSTGFVVPDDAVQRIDGKDVVFVRTEKGFRVAPVTVGARTAGRVAIVAGVAEGQSVASTNAFLLKAELGKSTEDEE